MHASPTATRLVCLSLTLQALAAAAGDEASARTWKEAVLDGLTPVVAPGGGVAVTTFTDKGSRRRLSPPTSSECMGNARLDCDRPIGSWRWIESGAGLRLRVRPVRFVALRVEVARRSTLVTRQHADGGPARASRLHEHRVAWAIESASPWLGVSLGRHDYTLHTRVDAHWVEGWHFAARVGPRALHALIRKADAPAHAVARYDSEVVLGLGSALLGLAPDGRATVRLRLESRGQGQLSAGGDVFWRGFRWHVTVASRSLFGFDSSGGSFMSPPLSGEDLSVRVGVFAPLRWLDRYDR